MYVKFIVFYVSYTEVYKLEIIYYEQEIKLKTESASYWVYVSRKTSYYTWASVYEMRISTIIIMDCDKM